jgi:hypothetical protein
MTSWWKRLCVRLSPRPAPAGAEAGQEAFPDKATVDGLFQVIRDGRALPTGLTAEQRRRLGAAERCLRRAIRTKASSHFFDALCELRLALGVGGSTPGKGLTALGWQAGRLREKR